MALGNDRILAGGGIQIVWNVPVPHLFQKSSLLVGVVVPVHVEGNGLGLVASNHFPHEVVLAMEMKPDCVQQSKIRF